MSKCLTVADETIDQKETCTEKGPRDIVELILEEALFSAIIIADKGCSRIGDFNIADQFCQQYDQLSNLKGLELVNNSKNQSESNLNSGENLDRLVTTKEHLELIIDSFVKEEETLKPGVECKIISEPVLADNELQIKDGKINLKTNKPENPQVQTYFDEKTIKNEKIDIEYYNEGKLNKIYVPLNPSCSLKIEYGDECGRDSEQAKTKTEDGSQEKGGKSEREDVINRVPSKERPFEPFTTEELRQTTLQEWENNCALVGNWDGDITTQKEEAVRIMETLSSAQMFPDYFSDPNRPRACSFAEEAVRKMTKEIQEINFTQSHSNSSDGQGDADSESRLFTKNKMDLDNLPRHENSQISDFEGNNVELRQDETQQEFHKEQFSLGSSFAVKSSEELIENKENGTKNETNSSKSKLLTDNIKGEYHLRYKVTDEECLLKSRLFSESKIRMKDSTEQLCEPSFNIDIPADRLYDVKDRDSSDSSLVSTGQETESKTRGASIMKVVDMTGFQNDFAINDEFIPESVSLSGNIGSLKGSRQDELDFKTLEFASELGIRTDENTSESSVVSTGQEAESKTRGASIMKVVDMTGFQNDFAVNDEFIPESVPLSGNIGSRQDGLDFKTLEFASELGIRTDENTSESSVVSTGQEAESKTRGASIMKVIDTTGFQNDFAINDEFIPESVSLSGNIDLKSYHGRRSDTVKGSRSASDAHDVSPRLSFETQGTSVLEKPVISDNNSFSEEKGLSVPGTESNSFDKKTEEKTDGTDAGDFLQKSNSGNGEIFPKHLTAKEINGSSLESACEKDEVSPENLKERDNDVEKIESGRVKINDSDSIFTQNKNSMEETISEPENKEADEGVSGNEPSEESVTENWEIESSNATNLLTKQCKLHAPKMYLGLNHEPVSESYNENTLTESKESLINYTESVLQIIEPPEQDTNEDDCKISFSLLSEISDHKSSTQCDVEPESHSSPLNDSNRPDSGNENPIKKIYSRMTTVGPMKYTDYDPKDLTFPEIDYGKMTRITSSRQLATDISLFSSEVSTSLSVKIIEEDDNDNDENASLNDDDRLERTSLVSRDIASLTKVQKIREVMSYQLKPEEDFEDEETLPRPRLDLKDVESMIDERYKVPDVGLPLLSFDLGESSPDAEKELVESVGLVISSLTNPEYYNEEFEREDTEKKEPFNDYKNPQDSNILISKQSSKTLKEDSNRAMSIKSLEKEFEQSKTEIIEKAFDENNAKTVDSDSQFAEGVCSHSKYATLGDAFKKTSGKFIRKDSDFLMRNSKSLPRNTKKIPATESIRSLLDDCQSSAASVLKKSKSLLRNTQSIFKSLSQSRVTADRESDLNPDDKNLSSFESDAKAIEKKISNIFKKEEFTKAKNLIKHFKEKSLKQLDSSTRKSTSLESEEKELRVAVRDEKNLRMDRMENFKKLLPKSPLVYKSQFVKSQASFQVNLTEPDEISLSRASVREQEKLEEDTGESLVENDVENVPEQTTVSESQEQEISDEICFEKTPQWTPKEEALSPPTNEEFQELEQPAFIVMETIQGLPTTDLDSPSNEKENLNVENFEKVTDEKAGNDFKTSGSRQKVLDEGHDVAACFPEMDEDKMATKSPSERRIKTQKKKFTSRIRNFWSSAFGRVKKSDLS